MADAKQPEGHELRGSRDHSDASDDEKGTRGRQTSIDFNGSVGDPMGGPTVPPLAEGSTPNVGVSKAQAFNRMLYESGTGGKILLLTLIVSLGCTMFVYALDNGITYQFTLAASAEFKLHAEIGAVQTAGQIINAVSKPFLAKFSDITSRPTTYTVVLVFYVVGFAVAASGTTLASYIVGIAFTQFGKSGLDLLGDIIVADLTTLEWRGFWGSMLSVPFLVTTFVDGIISNAFVPNNWRWGLGMFAIMVPVLLSPAIITLYLMQIKAKKHGMISAGATGLARRGEKTEEVPYWKLAWEGFIDADIFGLILLGFAFSLILLPITLARSAKGGWDNPSMIAMIVIGFVILISFVAYEYFLAPKPLATRRVFRNKAFLAAVGVDVCVQLASGLRTTYFASYIWVITPWSNYVWTIFLATVTLGLCFLGPIAGLIQRKTHRYKSLTVFGSLMKLIANGILLTGGNGKVATRSIATLAVSQVMFAFGAFTVVGTRVGSQASVPHEDVATVIAQLSLWSSLGASVGYAIGTAIWTSLMVPYMEEALPTTPTQTIRTIYGSIVSLRKYPFGSTIREGGIEAYMRVMGVIFIVSTVVGAVGLIFACLMPNYYLGKQQNAVTGLGPDGRPVDTSHQDKSANTSTGFLGKLKRLYYKES